MSLITNDRVLETEIPPNVMLLRDGKMDHIKSILEPLHYSQRIGKQSGTV